jgi:DNA-binding phage protein
MGVNGMIDPLSGNSAAYTQALTSTGSTTSSPQTSVLSNVANLLGMSTDDLTTALRNGSSMSDLASQKGISRDDLLAAINQGLQSSANTAASGQTDTSSLAGQIADRKGVGGHHHHHHGGGGDSSSTDLQQNVTDLASSLGISSDQLVQALQTGLASSSTSGTPGYGVSASLLQGLQFDQLA